MLNRLLSAGRAAAESGGYTAPRSPEYNHADATISRKESAPEVAMTRQFDVVVERDAEGYFVASVPALPGCHTQAKSLDELMARIRHALELCLEEGGHAPEELDFVGVQRVTVEV